MNAEKIIEMISKMGNGIFVIAVVLVVAVLIVAWMRMKSSGADHSHKKPDNPAGEGNSGGTSSGGGSSGSGAG